MIVIYVALKRYDLETPGSTIHLLNKGVGARNTWIAGELCGGEVTGRRAHCDNLGCRALLEDDLLGPGCTGTTVERGETVGGSGLGTGGTERAGGLILAIGRIC
jgi:hypothetical protein